MPHDTPETQRAPASAPAHPPPDLDAILDDFVRSFGGMRQRDARWYAAMGLTVGGSELAAIMGLSPYSGLADVVANKVAILEGRDNWAGGGEACWWGTLFEDVIGAYVAADLGAPVRGDDICIQAFAGHRNSPDGYAVVRLGRDGAGGRRLWTTDMPPDAPTVRQIALLEFKCPMSRKPRGAVPRHYVPQVWSGLAVSPVASFGLFVDAVFRKCGIADLGDTAGYDTRYHRFDRGAWELPVAWGLIGVYAPRADAPRRARLGWRGDEWAPGDPDPDAADADAAQAAWQIHAAYFGLAPSGQDTAEVADLGDMEAKLFNRALGLIDRKRFAVLRGPPCFADGRGAPLHTDEGVGGAIEGLRRGAPAGHWLLGVLPWKLFEVDYVPVRRRAGFMEEVAPLIEGVHRAVREARAAPDPAAYIAGLGPPRGAKRARGVDDDSLQDLFDSVAA
jgi:hypothetical protein